MPGSLAAPFPSARATVTKGGTPFSRRISAGNYGGSPSAARDFSPVPQNVTYCRARGIRRHVPPVGGAVMREKWSRALGDEGPRCEVEENFPACRCIIVRAQREPPLEPQHERQRGGDEQAVGEMPVHERPHREVRFQQPAVHRVGRARGETDRIPPVTELRRFQSNAKIAAPDAAARRSFRRMITRRRYPRQAQRQVIMRPPARNRGSIRETTRADFPELRLTTRRS